MSESELDALAVRMESAVDRFIGDQNASKNFVLVKLATDNSAGAYPQALLDKTKKSLEDDGDSYYDRFPTIYEPILLKLARSAKWTDVLSAQLWSEGLLVADSALKVLNKFNLGRHKMYKSEVRRAKEMREYTYLFLANHVSRDDIDFAKSEFYIADMIGSPKRLIDISSADDYEAKREQAVAGLIEGCGRFSRIDCKAIRFRRGRVPKTAIFGLGKLSVDLYFRSDLCKALSESKISGFEFRRNNKLFD